VGAAGPRSDGRQRTRREAHAGESSTAQTTSVDVFFWWRMDGWLTPARGRAPLQDMAAAVAPVVSEAISAAPDVAKGVSAEVLRQVNGTRTASSSVPRRGVMMVRVDGARWRRPKSKKTPHIEA
jgi:hypothetical protein